MHKNGWRFGGSECALSHTLVTENNTSPRPCAQMPVALKIQHPKTTRKPTLLRIIGILIVAIKI